MTYDSQMIATDVERYCDEHGFSPTLRELAEHRGMAVSTVIRLVERAVGAGLLSFEGGDARTLRPVRKRCSHGRP